MSAKRFDLNGLTGLIIDSDVSDEYLKFYDVDESRHVWLYGHTNFEIDRSAYLEIIKHGIQQFKFTEEELKT